VLKWPLGYMILDVYIYIYITIYIYIFIIYFCYFIIIHLCFFIYLFVLIFGGLIIIKNNLTIKGLGPGAMIELVASSRPSSS